MARKCVIIGLGAFGFHLTKALYERGLEVLAIDHDKSVIQRARDHCSKAALADAVDKEALTALDVGSVDFAVVAVGGERMDYSILVTMSLKELGVKKIYVKAHTEDHAKVVSLLGVTEVIFPERDMASKLATALISPNLLDHLPIMEGYSIIEISAPSEFIGKTLSELKLRNRFGVQVIAIRELIPERIEINPAADFALKDSDVLVVMGRDDQLEALSALE